MMTEDEAKTKWCPMARGQNWDDRRSEDGSFTANRLQSGDPLAACLCLGSRCMMWRWGKTHVTLKDLSEEDRKTAPTEGVGPNDLVMSWRTYGFCGLAPLVPLAAGSAT